MAVMLQPQQQFIDPCDVTTAVTRDLPRDLMAATSSIELGLDDSLLQQSFYDVIDTSQLLDSTWMTTAHAADDSGFSLSQSVNHNDHFSLGIPPGIPCYDITTEHVTGTPRYDVFEPTSVEIPKVTLPNDVWSTVVPFGNPCDDVIRETPSSSNCCSSRFTDDQIVCICTALQQKRDIDKLEAFLSTLATPVHHSQLTCRHRLSHSSRKTCCDDNLLPAATTGQSAGHTTTSVCDAVLSSLVHVAFHRGRYQQLYDIVRSHSFSPVCHGSLQQLWYSAHYSQAETLRRRPLSAVDKYRIRRRHPLPTTIWDGENTVYCIKVGLYRLHSTACLSLIS